MVDNSFTEYVDNLPDIVDILPEKFQSFKVSKFHHLFQKTEMSFEWIK